MASVIFPRAEIEKEMKLTPETLDKIMMLGIPVERITEKELEIQVLSNRPDLIPLSGFLRAVKAYLSKSTGLQKYVLKPAKDHLLIDKSLPKEWPYAVACVIKGLSLTDEKIRDIINIQEKLGATMLRKRKKGGIGVYPLEKIQFPIKFVGMHPDKIRFRPLEYPEIITGRQILSLHPTGREYAHLCSSWSSFPVFIDAKKEIMSMPPIINSHNLGKINEHTRDVFVEATGTDLNILQKVLAIISTALADMGGTVFPIICTQSNGKKVITPNLAPEKKKISLDNVNSYLGLDLKEKDLEKLLPRMGYEYKNKVVSIPAWRTDIMHEVDIIEDIAIAYGYDKLIPDLPAIATLAEESEESKLRGLITESLVGLGLLEINTYHLITTEEASIFPDTERIELENAKTEFKVLRPDLVTAALRVLSENKDNEYPQALFEMGTVFKKDKKQETGIAESLNLAILNIPGNFTEIKQILDFLASALSISYTLKESASKRCIEGRTASIIIDNQEIGYLGELHPEALRDCNIKLPVCVLELSLDQLIKK